MKLEIGPGDLPTEGYLHYDMRPLSGVEVCGDGMTLPFKDNSFTEIFGQHVLEHWPRDDTVRVLREWVRVLEPRGVIRTITPNLTWLMACYFHNPNAKHDVVRWLYGGQEYPGNFHYTAFDFPLLYEAMHLAGLTEIKLWDGKSIADFGLFMEGMKPSPIILV